MPKKPTKKAAKKTTATKKTTTAKKKAVKKQVVAKETQPESKKKGIPLSTKKRETPSIFKIKSKKNTPIVFSMEDVKGILDNKDEVDEKAQKARENAEVESKKEEAKRKREEEKMAKALAKKSSHGAASLSDILGFNPKDKKSAPNKGVTEADIEKRFLPYYRQLLDLREHVMSELDFLSQDTLKRSSKDDSGDLSGYSQHMADAGTDTFDRDFALSLLSTEQDALYEIEEAIQRIIEGSYGVCEITGEKIKKERLKAVPFTRYSFEGQKQLEMTQHKRGERGGVFAESSLEDSARYTDVDQD